MLRCAARHQSHALRRYFVLISGRSWKGRRSVVQEIALNARLANPALILGYNKGSGRGRRASASAVREPPARLRTALIRIAQRPPGLHTERPWRRTAGLSGSVRHQNNERKRFAFRVDAGDDQPWPAALRPGLTGAYRQARRRSRPTSAVRCIPA